MLFDAGLFLVTIQCRVEICSRRLQPA